MIVIRPVQHSDIELLYNLAKRVGPGMTTFPADKQVLGQKIVESEKAFLGASDNKKSRSFLMVLEDTVNGSVMGTAAVYSDIGTETPFYTFKILSRDKYSYEIKAKVASKTLHLVNEYTGDTEVGTLILDPTYRGGGYGKLLSKCRYMLIAQFPEYFSARVVAELRGWADENSESPFWEAVGKHFFGGMEYGHADFLSGTTNNQFISDLMPNYPIYIDLLPNEAQRAIGKPHNVGKAALNMLINEGFRYENYIDIFDGGPTVHAYTSNIETVSNSRIKTIQTISDDDQSTSITCLVCNTSLNHFRVCQINVHMIANDYININQYGAKALNVCVGDNVRVYPLKQ